jgi:hypothetical protein
MFPPVSQPYEQTVGQFAAYVRKSAGSEPPLPKKIALTTLKLTGYLDAPLRLLLARTQFNTVRLLLKSWPSWTKSGASLASARRNRTLLHVLVFLST